MEPVKLLAASPSPVNFDKVPNSAGIFPSSLFMTKSRKLSSEQRERLTGISP